MQDREVGRYCTIPSYVPKYLPTSVYPSGLCALCCALCIHVLRCTTMSMSMHVPMSFSQCLVFHVLYPRWLTLITFSLILLFTCYFSALLPLSPFYTFSGTYLARIFPPLCRDVIVLFYLTRVIYAPLFPPSRKGSCYYWPVTVSFTYRVR